MAKLKRRAVAGVVCFYHATVVVLLAIQPWAVLKSDMILQQAVDGDANETKAVQFGFRMFRSYDGQHRSINYSLGQYEVFDKVFYMAKKMAEVSTTLSELSWMIPLAGILFMTALDRCMKCFKSTKNFYEKNKGWIILFVIYLYPLILILSNILTMLAIPVLSKSNLCGPNLIELGYDGDGTIALIHNETKASCSISEDTKKFRMIPSIVGTVLLSVELIVLWVCLVMARLQQSWPPQMRPGSASRRAPLARSRNNKPEQRDDTDGESIRSSEATIASSLPAEDLEDFEQSTTVSEPNDADSPTAPTETNDVDETWDMGDLELGTDSTFQNTSVTNDHEQPTSTTVDGVVHEESGDGDSEKESMDGERLSAKDLEDFEQSTTASETNDAFSLAVPTETNDFEETLDVGDLELWTDSPYENTSVTKGHEQPTSASVDEIVHAESGDEDSENECTHGGKVASIEHVEDGGGLTEQNTVTDEGCLAPDEESVVSEDLEANKDCMYAESAAGGIGDEDEPGAVLESTDAENVETDDESVSSNEAGPDVKGIMTENEIVTVDVAESDVVVEAVES